MYLTLKAFKVNRNKCGKNLSDDNFKATNPNTDYER
jgi:hypothetical protein